MRHHACELVALCALLPALSWAQGTGQFSGLVTDPSGAVVPNATVAATESATHFSRATVTNSAGVYTLPSLPVGAYTITVAASGFKSATAEATLDVTQQREINFRISVSQVSSEVQVSAAPPLLNTQNATLGQLVTGQQVNTLPLNGRDVSNLILLQPGTAVGQNAALAHTQYPGVNWVANNGGRAQFASSYLDGIDTSDNEMGGQQLTNFNLDAIGEFEVMQNNFSAKYGRGAGMILSLVSKSGTNQFHGDLFEYVRNTDFNARNFFSSTIPPLQRNEFGGTVGGPIVKDRTFFFFEYAGLRQVSGPPVSVSVPTAAQRQGLVSAKINGVQQTLMVPVTPAGQTILNEYPMPNNPNGAFGAQTYTANLKTPITENQASLRIDHRFSDADQLFGRMTYSNNAIPIFNAPLAVINPSWTDARMWNVRNLGVTETHLFSPQLLNSLTLSWVRTIETDTPSSISNLVLVQASDGLFSEAGPYRAGFTNQPDGGDLNENVTLQRGHHSVNIGFEWRMVSNSEGFPGAGYVNGFYTFSPGTLTNVAIPFAGGGSLPAGSASPNSLVSLMLGRPQSVAQSSPFPGFGSPGSFIHFTLKDWNTYAWIQDDYKFSSRLTLNLGFRYEFNSIPREVDSRIIALDTNPADANFHRVLLNPQPLWNPDHRGFGPRFGLAYQVRKNTVIRGGFGIFTTSWRMQFPENAASSFPMAALATFITPPFSTTPVSVFTPGVVLTDLSGNPLPPQGNTKLVPPNTPISFPSATKALGVSGLIGLDVVDRGLKDGYIESANITLEHQFGDTLFAQAAYVATNSVGLYGVEWPNAYQGAQSQYTPYSAANPGLGEIFMISNSAHSTYNSLQAMFRKTSSVYGLVFQGAYTYAKELDNASGDTNGSASNAGRVQNNPLCWSCERAPGNQDVAQRFVFNTLYNLPFGKATDGWRRLITGWQVGGILTAQTGSPFTILSPYGTAQFGTNASIGNTTRPFLVQNPDFNTGTNAQYFSQAVVTDGKANGQTYFATPHTGSLQTGPGNLGRNTFFSPAWWDLDFTTLKDTHLTERYTLQFRGEFFNVLNLHDFSTPGAVLGSAGFGRFSSTVFPERQIQFAMKLLF